MSNLGWYQVLTTMAKKVGGPRRLIALLIGAGAVLGGGAVKGGAVIKSKVASEMEKKQNAAASAALYTVTTEGGSSEGIRFNVGDRFRILETDGDIGLIDRIGDTNSPYYVSLSFLSSISDYQKTPGGKA